MSTQQQKQMSRANIEEAANLLAKNARLDDPLPLGTDLSAAELAVVPEQLRGLAALPNRDQHHLYLAFSARHLVALAHVLRASRSEARSTCIQILSLLPGPMHSPYLLHFLMSDRVAGLPDIVAEWFPGRVHDPERPSTASRAPFCALLAHFLFY
ncbi:hypothetical protein PsYK624_121880 [Phanerochaete sordida]|uniref:Uncharacterized protein n=1 Tax=Phanerochaete sordida TaxID=48140 RepID=A0A9P3LI48_9APHY|nr:hypothetical protein PsYK624_121880 [Phanerochaete sordida]